MPSDVLTHWNTDPLLLISLLLPVYLYLRGAASYRVEMWRTALFIGGMTALFAALVSPLDAVSESLFSAHMLQHLNLMLVAAPLLVLSRPAAPILRGMPVRWRKAIGAAASRPGLRSLWHRLTHPLPALILHVAAVLLWHMPGLYGAALENPTIHVLEHASFFGTAALFWSMLHSTSDFSRRVLPVFGMMMASGLLGALMTFAQTPWYAGHAAYTAAWGLTALEDQQLAGVLMWIPAGAMYVAVVAVLLGTWLGSLERRTAEREHLRWKELPDA